MYAIQDNDSLSPGFRNRLSCVSIASLRSLFDDSGAGLRLRAGTLLLFFLLIVALALLSDPPRLAAADLNLCPNSFGELVIEIEPGQDCPPMFAPIPRERSTPERSTPERSTPERTPRSQAETETRGQPAGPRPASGDMVLWRFNDGLCQWVQRKDRDKHPNGWETYPDGRDCAHSLELE